MDALLRVRRTSTPEGLPGALQIWEVSENEGHPHTWTTNQDTDVWKLLYTYAYTYVSDTEDPRVTQASQFVAAVST